MSLFDRIKEALNLIKEAQTADVLRERLEHVKDLLSSAEKELAELVNKNSSLLRENVDLRKELSVFKKESEYIDLGICALKANPAGGYFDTPLCPSCKKPLSRFASGHLICGSCAIKLDPVTVNAAVKKALAS